MFVVGFAHVDGAHKLSVYVMAHRRVVLQVHVNPAGPYNALQCGILDTAQIVVSATTELQCLVLQIRFVGEELIIQIILSFVFLSGLNLETEWGESLAVSATTAHVSLHVYQRFTRLRIKHFKIHRPVPVMVPVAVFACALSSSAVCAFGKETYGGVIEMVGICHHGHHRNVERLVTLYVRAGHHRTAQTSVLKKSETIDTGTRCGQFARGAGSSVLHSGGGTVHGVAERRSLGDVHRYA